MSDLGEGSRPGAKRRLTYEGAGERPDRDGRAAARHAANAREQAECAVERAARDAAGGNGGVDRQPDGLSLNRVDGIGHRLDGPQRNRAGQGDLPLQAPNNAPVAPAPQQGGGGGGGNVAPEGDDAAAQPEQGADNRPAEVIIIPDDHPPAPQGGGGVPGPREVIVIGDDQGDPPQGQPSLFGRSGNGDMFQFFGCTFNVRDGGSFHVGNGSQQARQ